MGSCRHQPLAFIRWLHLSIFRLILHVHATIAEIVFILCIIGSQQLKRNQLLRLKSYFGKKLAIVVPSLGFKLRRTSALSKGFEVGG